MTDRPTLAEMLPMLRVMIGLKVTEPMTDAEVGVAWSHIGSDFQEGIKTIYAWHLAERDRHAAEAEKRGADAAAARLVEIIIRKDAHMAEFVAENAALERLLAEMLNMRSWSAASEGYKAARAFLNPPEPKL
jgi:hypothetical protein